MLSFDTSGSELVGFVWNKFTENPSNGIGILKYLEQYLHKCIFENKLCIILHTSLNNIYKKYILT